MMMEQSRSADETVGSTFFIDTKFFFFRIEPAKLLQT